MNTLDSTFIFYIGIYLHIKKSVQTEYQVKMHYVNKSVPTHKQCTYIRYYSEDLPSVQVESVCGDQFTV